MVIHGFEIGGLLSVKTKPIGLVNAHQIVKNLTHVIERVTLHLWLPKNVS